MHGTFGFDVDFDDANLYVSSKKIAVTHEREIKNLNTNALPNGLAART